MYLTPQEIRFELDKLEIYQADIAHELDMSEAAVSRNINGTLCTKIIMDAVAAKIGRKPDKVFEKYPTS